MAVGDILMPFTVLLLAVAGTPADGDLVALVARPNAHDL